MGYYIDLERVSLGDYKEVLKTADLIPSWMILREHIDQNFDTLKAHGIEHLAALHKALKSKSQVQVFSQKTELPEDYLQVLRRVVHGLHPKPNKFADFPCLSERVSAKLEEIGIRNTLQAYDRITTPEKRQELCHETGISSDEVMKITRLTDLSRVRWVNHTFACVLLEAGYASAEEVARADHREMYENVKQLNEEKQVYRGNIGVRDMNRCVEAARGLDFEIVYADV